jgi:hypothetical protein
LVTPRPATSTAQPFLKAGRKVPMNGMWLRRFAARTEIKSCRYRLTRSVRVTPEINQGDPLLMEAAALPQPSEAQASTRKTVEERKELLARTLTSQIAAGARVESQSDFQVVVIKGKPVNHTLQLILTLVTFTLWAPVWIALAIFGGEKRGMVVVDEYGNAAVQKL